MSYHCTVIALELEDEGTSGNIEEGRNGACGFLNEEIQCNFFTLQATINCEWDGQLVGE